MSVRVNQEKGASGPRFLLQVNTVTSEWPWSPGYVSHVDCTKKKQKICKAYSNIPKFGIFLLVVLTFVSIRPVCLY